jgi:hypothetical protein
MIRTFLNEASWMKHKKTDKMPDSFKIAPVAQLDRVPGYELGGREFESLRARQKISFFQ